MLVTESDFSSVFSIAPSHCFHTCVCICTYVYVYIGDT